MVSFSFFKYLGPLSAAAALFVMSATACQDGRPLFISVPTQLVHPVPLTATPSRPTPVTDACKACGSPRQWPEMTDVPVLFAGLKLAYDRYPPARLFLDFAATAGVRVVVNQPSDPDAIADYNPSSRVIRVAPAVLSEPPAVVASLLLHELIHANQTYDLGPEACIYREVVAYSFQASSFVALRTGREATPFARFEEDLVAAWRAGELDALVRGWPLYRRECFGAK